MAGRRTLGLEVIFIAALMLGACGSSSDDTGGDAHRDGATAPEEETSAAASEDGAADQAEDDTTTTDTTTTAAPSSTATTAPAPTTAPPTAPPRLTLTGTVDVLDQVWFDGLPDELGGPPYSPPPPGSSCSGRDGFADLAPGAPVLISEGSGAALASVQLGAGTRVHQVLNTESERRERDELIDSIFDLRVAIAGGDPVAVAEVEVARAEQQLADVGALPSAPFEGHPLAATWCRFTFTAPDLPLTDTYGVAVTHRGIQTFPRGVIEASGAALVVG